MRFVAKDTMVDMAIGYITPSFEEALRSSIIMSLLTDRYADQDDLIPDAPSKPQAIPFDRRGWAGDALSEVPNDRIGSRLWLLSREKQTESTRVRAIEYCQEALQWLVDDRIATSVYVEAAWGNDGRLNVSVTISLSSGDIFTTSVTVGVIYAI